MARSRSDDDVVTVRNVSSWLKKLKTIPPIKPIIMIRPVYGTRREANIVLKRPFVLEKNYKLSR
jgi:hypothetical protein